MAEVSDLIDDALIAAFVEQGWIMRADGGMTTPLTVLDRAVDVPRLRDHLIESLGLTQRFAIYNPARGDTADTFADPEEAARALRLYTSDWEIRPYFMTDWRSDVDGRAR
ncbi:hypothetical protein [Mycobacteroides abscessus]|uniref:hypothetical protein n=1 Tax=Mycobacteroides abscessus TaxID=36809 RepID=UPI0005DFE6D2|nr:hypothetical protein [Mycobacteroides abscessus]CPW71715.1 Uncharacterised protein [Mycobacteroides abscessus]SKF62131.1 Uncharacterised protein [Mycobacteroides abscessus subsp. bolletii]SKH91528.1 Uncharacterised protein [Mycobacteroides abscessus subsp. bolletii]